jgi:hypothetical protein
MKFGDVVRRHIPLDPIYRPNQKTKKIRKSKGPNTMKMVKYE